MFTERQQLLLKELELGNILEPKPFLEVDFKIPFVYDPKWGVFYCESGQHARLRAALVCIHLGCDTLQDAANQLRLGGSDEFCYFELADYWMEHYHGCFKSSCACEVDTWDANSLEEWEQNIIKSANRTLRFYTIL